MVLKMAWKLEKSSVGTDILRKRNKVLYKTVYKYMYACGYASYKFGLYTHIL